MERKPFKMVSMQKRREEAAKRTPEERQALVIKALPSRVKKLETEHKVLEAELRRIRQELAEALVLIDKLTYTVGHLEKATE